MRAVETSIIINAEPWEVWDVLTKVYEYDNWNPTYKYVKGIMEVDEYVTIEIAVDTSLISTYMEGEEAALFATAPSRKPKMYQFKVQSLDENEYLEWESKQLGGLLFHHTQTFELKPSSDNKTLFINNQKLGGVVPSLMPNNIFKAYFKGASIALNEALKSYVEEP